MLGARSWHVLNARRRDLRSSLKGSGEAQNDPAVMRTGLEGPRLDTGEIREGTSRKTGGQESLKTRAQLGALSSEFPLGKSLSLDTSPSGDLLALVSGMAGESLFAHLMSSWSLWETGHFVFTALLPYLSLSSPVPAQVPLEMMIDLRHSTFLFLNHP